MDNWMVGRQPQSPQNSLRASGSQEALIKHRSGKECQGPDIPGWLYWRTSKFSPATLQSAEGGSGQPAG